MDNITSFLQNEYTLTFSGLSISLISILMLIGFGFILFLLVKLQRKFQEIQTPQYGFLGKPLMQMGMIGLIVVGVAFSIYTTTKETKIQDISASEEISIDLMYNVIEEENGRYKTEFKITPYVNEKEWGGDDNRNFDIFVNISGEIEEGAVLYSRTRTSSATFTKNLPSGTYSINITVFSGETSETFTRQINL